jgi:hypothetical protein
MPSPPESSRIGGAAYGLGPASLSAEAAAAVESADEIRVSPMARLELQHLHEIGRVSEPALPVLDALHAAIGVTVCTKDAALHQHYGACVW